MFEITLFSLILSVLQFEPAPRRGEPDVTRRTPDYFLWSKLHKLGDFIASVLDKLVYMLWPSVKSYSYYRLRHCKLHKACKSCRWFILPYIQFSWNLTKMQQRDCENWWRSHYACIISYKQWFNLFLLSSL